LRYIHLCCDEQGESYVADREMEVTERDYAPPAPPLGVSPTFPTKNFHVISLPPGWYGDWHPVPQRQWMMVLSGATAVEVSSGEHRSVAVGTVALLEDTRGRGHRSWNTDDDDLIVAVAVACDE
jgi:hypothetical protein